MNNSEIEIKVVGTILTTDIKVGDVLIEGNEDVVHNGKGLFLTVTNVHSKASGHVQVEFYDNMYYHTTSTAYCHYKVAGQRTSNEIEVYRIIPYDNIYTYGDNQYEVIGYCDYKDVKDGDSVLVGDIIENNIRKIDYVNSQVLGNIQYEWDIIESNGQGRMYVPCIHCLFKIVYKEHDNYYKVLKFNERI